MTSLIRTLELDSTATGVSTADLDDIAIGITNSLHDVAHVWGEYVWHVVDLAAKSGFHVVVQDTLDVQGALGYHDIDDQGRPVAFIGAQVCAQAGVALSSVVDHEVKELVADPAANLWATDGRGVNWARELCDAVEGDSYDDTTTGIALSNWLYPSYFNPFASGSFDHLGSIRAPFTIAPNGYAIRLKGGTVSQVFGDAVTEERKAFTGGRVLARRAWVALAAIDDAA